MSSYASIRHAVRAWVELAGPSDPEEARRTRPRSLRAVYGTDAVRNALHAPASPADAQRSIRALFPGLVHEPLLGEHVHAAGGGGGSVGGGGCGDGDGTVGGGGCGDGGGVENGVNAGAVSEYVAARIQQALAAALTALAREKPSASKYEALTFLADHLLTHNPSKPRIVMPAEWDTSMEGRGCGDEEDEFAGACLADSSGGGDGDIVTAGGLPRGVSERVPAAAAAAAAAASAVRLPHVFFGKEDDVDADDLEELQARLMEQSAVRIQSAWRGHQQRKRMPPRRKTCTPPPPPPPPPLPEPDLGPAPEEPEPAPAPAPEPEAVPEDAEAVVKIQAAFRGHQVRKAMAEHAAPPPEPEDWSLETSHCFHAKPRTCEAKDWFSSSAVDAAAVECDWGRMMDKDRFKRLLDKSAPSGGEREALRGALKACYGKIISVFECYSQLGSGDPFSLGAGGWGQLVSQCRLADGASGAGLADLNLVFVSTNWEEKERGKASVAADLNADGALMRFEFVEALVRVAVLKGDKGTPLAPAVTALVDDFIWPTIPPEARIERDTFRRQRLYCRGVDDVFHEHRKLLRAVFDHYRHPDAVVSIAEWTRLWQDAQLLVQGRFTIREAKLAFLWSRMRTKDESSTKKAFMRARSLCYVECLEALGRASDLTDGGEGRPLAAGLEELVGRMTTGLLSSHNVASLADLISKLASRTSNC